MRGALLQTLNRQATWWLVAVNLLLALILALLWIGPHGRLRHLQWQAPEAQKLMLDPVSLQRGAAGGEADTARFVAILDRPLFSATRRPPPPPPPPPPPKPVDPLEGVKLVGVFQGGDDGGILAEINGKVRRLKLGTAIGDWTLKSLTSREATFANGKDVRVINLINARKPS